MHIITGKPRFARLLFFAPAPAMPNKKADFAKQT